MINVEDYHNNVIMEKTKGAKNMTQSITVTFDGQVLRPEITLDLTLNKKYKIAIIPDEKPAEDQKNAWDILEDLAGSYEGPEDWSSEHNYYFYGMPKEDLTDESN